MSLQINGGKKKIPIKRNNMFFSDADFQLENDFALDYIEHDANQTVILYQVDLEKTTVNDVYKEAKKENIRFKTPIELPCVYDIEDAELKTYNDKIVKGAYVKPGKITIQFLLKTLEENNCTIRRGDYIGIQVSEEERLYFSVNNDGKVQSYSNSNLLYGVKPYFIEVTANYVDSNEFNQG